MAEEKKVLFIAAGNMATPMIVEYLKQSDAKPENVTVITGTSEGKDAAALRKALSAEKINIDAINIMTRAELVNDPSKIEDKCDIVIYGAKPQQADDIFNGNRENNTPAYKEFIKNDATIISIAAGTPIEYFKEFVPNGNVVRSMPQTPKKVIGVYTDDDEALKTAKPFLRGLGEMIDLETEDQMHGFTATAGSGPALVAQFIASYPEEQQVLMAALRKKAQEQSDNRQNDKSSNDKVSVFYRNWKAAVGGKFTNINTVKLIANQTIIGTIDMLEEDGMTTEKVIAEVRSKKGTTNAALLVMGNPPPDDESFGTKWQLRRQREFTQIYKEMPPANTICAAVKASELRSRTLAKGGAIADNPLGGVARGSAFVKGISDLIDATAIAQKKSALGK